MNREVHYERTERWALDAGFSEEEAASIAEADWDVDRIFDVHRWPNKGYHFAWLGADRKARSLLARAIDEGDLVLLGRALHCAQDAIGHGFWGHLWHWHGIDRWAHRGSGLRGRIEARSKAMLAAYAAGRTRTPVGERRRFTVHGEY